MYSDSHSSTQSFIYLFIHSFISFIQCMTSVIHSSTEPWIYESIAIQTYARSLNNYFNHMQSLIQHVIAISCSLNKCFHECMCQFIHSFITIERFCTIMTAVVFSFFYSLSHPLTLQFFPKCSKNNLRRRPKTTVKAKTPSKCGPKQILLQSFHHVLTSSCMGSLLQRHKFIQTFALCAHAVKHVCVLNAFM